MKRAYLQEIFSSIQGEGPWIGERHIFVRFMGCDIHCRYCDTSAAIHSENNEPGPNFCSTQIAADDFRFNHVHNPVSSSDLFEYCSRLVIPGPSRPTVSLTGGEPLLHSDFLLEWLPLAKKTFKIYLETNGIHAAAMHDISRMVDVVSMDFKLPSATGLRPFWEEHKHFLLAAKGKTIFIKAVVTGDTNQDDIMISARIIAQFDSSIPLVIQPAGGPLAPASSMLVTLQEAALRLIPNVRVIPQAHKILHLP
ncbi:MAG TPA: 7-carboxy-7-deazaguanine synthase QueE [Nitrospirota bacterium]|nr:7-carboxy-7-deazaguanine synthase QueE [Nitrospirota bacterium]